MLTGRVWKTQSTAALIVPEPWLSVLILPGWVCIILVTWPSLPLDTRALCKEGFQDFHTPRLFVSIWTKSLIFSHPPTSTYQGLLPVFIHYLARKAATVVPGAPR